MARQKQDIDALLKERYGQAAFNPAEGQEQMSYQEWMDLHPALQQDKDHHASYNRQVGEQGGKEYQGAFEPGQYKQMSGPNKKADAARDLRVQMGPPELPKKGLTGVKNNRGKAKAAAARRRGKDVPPGATNWFTGGGKMMPNLGGPEATQGKRPPSADALRTTVGRIGPDQPAKLGPAYRQAAGASGAKNLAKPNRSNPKKANDPKNKSPKKREH